jgi:hypothetical protein
MNHFTPFFPAEALLRCVPISDTRASDLETRLLETTRMREKTQRRAEVALLVVTGFVFAFSFALKV